jgi:hypothetical protein
MTGFPVVFVSIICALISLIALPIWSGTQGTQASHVMVTLSNRLH